MAPCDVRPARIRGHPPGDLGYLCVRRSVADPAKSTRDDRVGIDATDLVIEKSKLLNRALLPNLAMRHRRGEEFESGSERLRLPGPRRARVIRLQGGQTTGPE